VYFDKEHHLKPEPTSSFLLLLLLSLYRVCSICLLCNRVVSHFTKISFIRANCKSQSSHILKIHNIQKISETKKTKNPYTIDVRVQNSSEMPVLLNQTSFNSFNLFFHFFGNLRLHTNVKPLKSLKTTKSQNIPQNPLQPSFSSLFVSLETADHHSFSISKQN
jgi:hypothetical protein